MTDSWCKRVARKKKKKNACKKGHVRMFGSNPQSDFTNENYKGTHIYPENKNSNACNKSRTMKLTCKSSVLITSPAGFTHISGKVHLSRQYL